MNANVCPSIYDADYRKLKTPPGRRSFLYDDEHQPLNFFVHGKVWVAFTPSFFNRESGASLNITHRRRYYIIFLLVPNILVLIHTHRLKSLGEGF